MPGLQGEAVKQDFFIILDNPVGATPLPLVSVTGDCCFKLNALAETTFTNDLYNDFHSPIFFWGNGFQSAVMKLQKYESGVWVDKDDLDNSDYGTFKAFGDLNAFQQYSIGYKLEWKLVLAEFGEGNYRVKCIGTSFVAAAQNKYSFEFCLKEYSPYRADKSVVITWNINGRVGDAEDDKRKRDFGILDWENQIRIEGRFGYDSSPQWERSYVKYQNGEMNWLEDSQVEEYTFKSGRYPNELHRFIKIDILQADSIIFTDYNINNPTKHTSKSVIPNGNYEPGWAANSQLASVELKFQQAYQNLNHKRA